jgi:hypothetical protein
MPIDFYRFVSGNKPLDYMILILDMKTHLIFGYCGLLERYCYQIIQSLYYKKQRITGF